MRTRLLDRLNSRLTGFMAIVLGVSVLLFPLTTFAQTISDDCAECHNGIYQEWKASGHPYKLMKGNIAQNRPIPLPKGYTWDDISYVIGGYKWKSRYMDNEGYIITQGLNDENDEAGNTQWNYLVGYWSNYHADEEDGTKPYNCGKCHTTGWVANENPENLSGNQDGLPGIHGTFQQGGIQCVQCHGGSMHADFGNVDKSADACGACHYRTAAPGDVNLIPASSGWIKHHEQYNEHLAGPHAAADCVACHNPHKRGEYSIWEVGDEGHEDGATCGVSCHSSKGDSFAMTTMADYGVTCKDCHMPFATKSAQPQGPNMGDVQTHIFYINTDPVDRTAMFNEAGTEVLLDNEGKAAVTLDFVCQRCHETASLDELSRHAKNMHGDDTTVSELEYIGVNPGLSGNWWGGQERNGEGFLIEVAEASGVPVLIISFYTYDSDGNQVYLIASGLIEVGSMDVDVTVRITEGRKWGESGNSADFTKVFGTGTFTFPACDVGSFTLTPNAEYEALGFTAIGYDLSRDITTHQIACPKFINNAN